MIKNLSRVVVIAPHPDDEVLGAGATIARLVNEGVKVSVLIVSGHLPPLYKKEAFETTRKEARQSMQQLGVEDYEFLEIPATLVHQKPTAEVNAKICSFVIKREPDMVLLPFPDRHIDHRTIFDASVVACRPSHKNAPKIVIAYETLSETHWNVAGIEPSFAPDLFIDTSKFMEKKIQALSCYRSQIQDTPSRSSEACMALAKFRGSQNNCSYAEAFKVVRIVI